MNVNTYKQDEEKTKFSFSNFVRIYSFVKPYKKKLFYALFMGILGSIFLLFIPKIMVYALDVSFVTKNFIEIVFLALLTLLIVFFSTILIKIKRDQLLIVLDNVSHDLKVAIFEKLQYLSNDYFDTRSHGKIYTRATTYPDEASGILCYVFLEVIIDLINLIFVVIFMLTTHVALSLISIFAATFLFFVFILLSPIRRKLKHRQNDKSSNVNAYISESIHGIRVTQSFNRERKNEEILKALENKRVQAVMKAACVSNLSWVLAEAFNVICMIIVYYIGLKYMYPAVSIGVILVIDSYSSRFWGPISYLMNSYDQIMEASVYLERIFELLDEAVMIQDKDHARSLEIVGNIKFRDVTFAYTEERMILEHLNFSIEAGKRIGLVGETGSGKTTILSLISRFYDVSEGSICIDDVDIRDIRLDSLRGQVGMMLQDNFLFARSVYDNLTLGKKISKKEVVEVCEMLGIHEMILKLEKGYETILLNNGSNLSSGQRQLLCIARIMIQNPKILILDEATSNIDLKTEKLVEKAMELVTKNRTTIMVAHRISTIQSCDKIILIKNKGVYEEGTHAELMKQQGEYYKLYTSQLSGV